MSSTAMSLPTAKSTASTLWWFSVLIFECVELAFHTQPAFVNQGVEEILYALLIDARQAAELLRSELLLREQQRDIVAEQGFGALAQEKHLGPELLGEHVELMQAGLQVVEKLREVVAFIGNLRRLDDLNGRGHVVE